MTGPASPPRAAAVIGGGIMGADIAAILVAGGWAVHVMSPSAATRDGLAGRVAGALAAMGAAEGPAGALAVHATLAELPWPSIDLVVEAVSEDLPLKQRVFAELGARARPDAILATNTSGLSVAAIARDAVGPERVAGLHFFMPAHLVPLVEVVSTERTDPAVAERLMAEMRSLGRAPIQVARDLPGFVGNRLQHALVREALWLVAEGIATPEDVDTAVRCGFGFRYVACGPMLQKEMSGWDTNLRAAQSIYPHLSNASGPPPALLDMVARGETGMKAGKGLWSWTPAAAAAAKARIERALRAGARILADDPS